MWLCITLEGSDEWCADLALVMFNIFMDELYKRLEHLIVKYSYNSVLIISQKNFETLFSGGS